MIPGAVEVDGPEAPASARDGAAAQVLVDGEGRPLAVRHGLDHDARTEGQVPAAVHPGHGGGEGARLDGDQTAGRDLDLGVAGEAGRVGLLAHRQDDRVGVQALLAAGGEAGGEAAGLVEHRDHVEGLEGGGAAPRRPTMALGPRRGTSAIPSSSASRTSSGWAGISARDSRQTSWT